MDANELPTLLEFTKLCAAFPRRDPQGTAALSVKYGYRGQQENGGTSYVRLQTSLVIRNSNQNLANTTTGKYG